MAVFNNMGLNLNYFKNNISINEKWEGEKNEKWEGEKCR